MNEPSRWASRVFGAFAKAYTDNLGSNGIWTLFFDETSSRKLGLTRQQAAAGLQLLKDKGLIRLMTPRDFRLTSRGMQVCAAIACETFSGRAMVHVKVRRRGLSSF